MTLTAKSPWYGMLEIVGEPNSGGMVEVWNGDHFSFVVAYTLQPLSRGAAAMLGVPLSNKITPERKRAWENGPLRMCDR